ncbi:4985_t:CDS:1, partial [Ambispora leptoticha]
HFYEPLMQFVTDQDPVLRIYQHGQLTKLPPGKRAYKMVDKVYEWHKFLKDVAMNFEMFFANELLEALESLSNEEFGTFFNDLELEINKALEYFEKWFLSWLHLPLVVCRLGGNNAQSFASSFYYVVLKKPWIKLPTNLELQFVAELENDLNNGITDDLGLRELLLQNENFFREFEQFCADDKPLIYNYPYLYNFVKTRIYFIIIHQQQVEGLFNKLDLKTHPNMSLPVKQSKLHLSSINIDKKNLSKELKEIRKNRKNFPLQEINTPQFGSNIASDLFKDLLC